MYTPANVSLDVIRIDCGDRVFCLDADAVYHQLRLLKAKDHIKELLAAKNYPPDIIETIVDDDFAQKWLSCNCNNTSIRECEELAAEILANERMVA